jgi:hypothetical protein
MQGAQKLRRRAVRAEGSGRPLSPWFRLPDRSLRASTQCPTATRARWLCAIWNPAPRGYNVTPNEGQKRETA